jgi:hypothetical protein
VVQDALTDLTTALAAAINANVGPIAAALGALQTQLNALNAGLGCAAQGCKAWPAETPTSCASASNRMLR